MKNLRILAIATALLVVTATGSLAGGKKDVNPGAAVADAVLVRPIMLGVSFVTSAIYAGTLPLTFLTNVDEPAGEYLVTVPWWYTSGRDLGRFDQPRKRCCAKRAKPCAKS